MTYLITETAPERDYELIDSGDGEKLERFGRFVTVRPDPQALWPKRLPAAWKNTDAIFGGDGKGSWRIIRDPEEDWTVRIGGLTFGVRLSAFKHVGIFPEHAPNWAWVAERIAKAKKPVRVLNLFGYTGGATLAAAQAGAEVVHVDGSKTAIKAGRENAERSGLGSAPIRWIPDDAATFVERECRRKNTYDGIIMDPPAFGHGANGEIWKIEDDLIPLVKSCARILSDRPLFVLMNGYASGYSALAYKQILESCIPIAGSTEIGELTIRESGDKPRLLPAGIFARWTPGRSA